MTVSQLFFELIQVAIGMRDGLSRIPSESEWEELYDMADKQSLIGICFAGLLKLGANVDDGYLKIGMSEELFFSWIGTAAAIQQKNKKMNKRCVELQQKLAEDGFKSCILKGQGVAALYRSLTPSPSPKGEGSLGNSSNALNIISGSKPMDLSLLRQSGDIDAWIDAPREDVIAYVKRKCPNDDVDISSKHLEFRLFKDTEIEAHFVPAGTKTPIIGRRVRAYYENEKAKQMKHKVMLTSGQEITAPDNAFQAIHILQHAFGHFLFEGIGFRQLMDYYFVMQQPLTDYEKKQVVRTMKRFGMYGFARGVAYILTKVFGAEESFIPANKSLGERILKSVMEEGNFGKHDEKRDNKKMNSSWYRFWYHNIRMWKYFDMAPWVISMSPLMRIHEYTWRFSHGYFKK